MIGVNSIKVIELEAWFANKYEGQPKIDEIHEFLNSFGFIFIGFSALYSDNSRNKIKSGLSFGDMIFIKNEITHRKVILSYLVTTCMDKFIQNLGLDKSILFKDKMLLYFIILLGKLKISAPKYF